MDSPNIPQPPTKSKGRLAEALEYTALGFSVIPLKPGAKTPNGRWEEYQTRKATKEELHRWFDGTDNNIAIVTGEISGVAIVDCDSPEAIDHVLRVFPSHQRTQTRNGLHFWFKHPGRKVRNSVNLHGIKMDIRGDGGYVVAPGSKHPTGFVYAKEGVWGPTASLPEFPAEIAQAGDKSTGISEAVKKYMDNLAPAVSGDGGNPRTFQACCRLVRGYALSEDDALAAMAAWNAKNLPPWSQAELRTLIRSAIKHGSEPIGTLAEEALQEWRTGLIENRAGKVIKHPNNLYLILDNDARFKGQLRLNTMTQEIYWRGNPVGEGFEVEIYNAFAECWGPLFSSAEVYKNAVACAHRNLFNPLRDFVEELPPWDGSPRIERVATEILGAEDTPLTQAMLRGFFVGAIHRALNPGCKLDTALVLIGEQGVGKSSFFRILGCGFHDDTPMESESKDRFLAIHKAWILELAELDGMTSAKTSQYVKALLSSSVDEFRPPYGRVSITAPRSCVMVGSTNTDVFLMDPTGSRRFWTVPVGGKINLPLLTEWVEQLWSEARALDSEGENWWLTPEMEKDRQEAAKRHTAADPWVDSIQAAIEKLAQRGVVLIAGITTLDLLDAMDIPVATRTRSLDMRVASILRRMGWERRNTTVDGRKANFWFPIANAPETVEAPY